MYEIIDADEVIKEDLPNILEPWKSEIRHAVETKLMIRPEIYSKPLRRSLKGYRKLRFGGYRIILRIEDDKIKFLLFSNYQPYIQSLQTIFD